MGSSLVPSKPAHQWPTDGTVRPRSWDAELPKAKRERVKDGRFLVRFLVLFAVCLGVVAILAWQSYGDAARHMIANTSPRLSWFAPSPASVGEVLPELGLRMAPVGEAILAAPSSDREQLKTLSAGLADVRQRIDQIAAQLPAVQEQMTRDISNKLEAVEHEIFEKVSAPPPRPSAAQPRKLAP